MNTNQPTNRDESITRWIDGEMDDADRSRFERELDTDADFASEVESVAASSRGLGDLLRSEFPSNIELPSPELFNARIMNHMQSEIGGSATGGNTVVRPAARFWSNMPWLIAAAAVLVVAFVFIQQKPGGNQSPAIVASEVSNTYAPREGVEIRTRFVPDAGVTVLSLDGLEIVPSSHEIEGELVASYLPSGPSNAPVFTSVESGKPLFVLLTGANNIPSIVRVPRD